MAWLCMLRPHYLFGQKFRFWQTSSKCFSGLFFFGSCVSKITPSPIPIKMGFWQGVFENDLQFVYKARTVTPQIFNGPSWTVDFRTNGGDVLSKFVPHLYEWKRRFEGVFWKKVHSIFTKSAPSKKHPLPISIKLAFWQPIERNVYKNSVLQIILSPNSHRKLKTAPPFQKLSSPIWKKSWV